MADTLPNPFAWTVAHTVHERADHYESTPYGGPAETYTVPAPSPGYTGYTVLESTYVEKETL